MYPSKLIEVLKSGGVAVIKTDTLYGLVGAANRQDTVERIYSIKGRTANKSPIVLINSLEDMFDTYDDVVLQDISEYWPGPNSIILPSKNSPDWISRGNHSVAYRLPKDDGLRWLISNAGPLVAPSANPEGSTPAASIKEAERYFGDLVDYYYDSGLVTGVTASSLYHYDDGKFTKLR